MQLLNSSTLHVTTAEKCIPLLNNINEKIVSILKTLQKQKETKNFSFKSVQLKQIKKDVKNGLVEKGIYTIEEFVLLQS